jgi:hypothetical protein
MDFFLPSLIVLILSGIIVFAFLPRMAPIILLLMSAGLLGFGIYHHYKIFEDEYRFSTWQDQLKMYAPGVVIGVTVLFLIGFILSFFGGPSVPVPNIPAMPSMPEIPMVNTVKNMLNISAPPTPEAEVAEVVEPVAAAAPVAPEPAPVPAVARLNNRINNRIINRTNNANINRIRGIRPSFIEEI